MNTNPQNAQGEQPKGAPVNPYLVVEAYKDKVDELTHRDVMMTAYVRQLEGTVKELNEKLEQREQELAQRVQELEQKELEQDEPTEE